VLRRSHVPSGEVVFYSQELLRVAFRLLSLACTDAEYKVQFMST
jgi:hypothetical protein